MNKNIYASGAIASGGLLAIAIYLNGELSRYTTPFYSSMIVHGIGLAGSWLLWKLLFKGEGLIPFSSKAPKWAYLGGVGGAMIVVLSNITVNSPIGLVGSLSLMILGQTIFAILFDVNGWAGMQKRRLYQADFLQLGCILVGAVLIVFFK